MTKISSEREIIQIARILSLEGIICDPGTAETNDWTHMVCVMLLSATTTPHTAQLILHTLERTSDKLVLSHLSLVLEFSIRNRLTEMMFGL